MKQEKDLIANAYLIRRRDLNREDECRDDVFYNRIVMAEIAKINTLRAERG